MSAPNGKSLRATRVDTSTGPDDVMASVGSRIRALRLAEGLTLKQLSDATGVSTSMLSMLERGQASASVGTLVSVSATLGVHMADLFDRSAEASTPITRKAAQPTAASGQGATRRVAHHDRRAGVELAVNEYEPGGSSGDVATHHEGREFGVLVTGSLQVELDGELHDLAPGDSISYESTRPHKITNRGRSRAVAIWVNISNQ